MRHRARVSTFGRKTGPRVALIRGLVNSLVEHGRIKTTLAKAKELRRHAEKAVTTSKEGSLHARRLLWSRYPNETTVSTLLTDLGPRFKARPGGYTRILKLGTRPGDKAEMAYIEWVDYVPKAKPASPAGDAEEAANAEADADAPPSPAKLAAARKKKKLRRAQEGARRVLRARA